MSTSLKSAFASIVSLSVVAGLAVSTATPASAAAPNKATAAVTELLDLLGNDFVPQLASGTALAEQLPTVAVTPASSVELKSAFADVLSTGALADFAAKPTLDELAAYIDGATGDGWTFDASATGSSVTIDFTREVTQDAGLDIRDEDGTITLSTGTGIVVNGTLEGSFTLLYDSTADLASLTSPSMKITTTADLPAGTNLDAGLGILGVSVAGAEGIDDYHLSSTVETAWANPDNDALESLAYDNPATPAPLDGELAADGAGNGLVTATRTGSLAGELVAKPRATSVVTGLPSVGATVTLTSATPATFETPLVTADVPDEAEPFLTMTPRDLAAGLSQAASAVIGMQDAEDGNLPLMRGSIGNAIDAVGGIKAFLVDQVRDPDTSDDTPGQPKFASLQDMLVALDGASYDSGWSIEVLGDDDAASFDPEDLVASFTIRTTRDGVEDLELNPLGAATTGKGTFSATGLSASGVDFNGPNDTAGAELVGRKVQAGASYGTIATIVDGNTLTLTPEGWSAGTPAKDTSFSIEAADPKTGAPELANALEAKTGIAVANADLSTATITPDVVVTLPMALDLSAPLTFAGDDTKLDCDPGPGEATCPFKQVDASGLGRVISSLPLAADRVLLRTSAREVLVADADITSPVQIGTTSGYLGLTINGNVDVQVPDGEHLQVLTLTGATGTTIPVPAFVEAVRKQAVGSGDAVFTQKLGGSVEADLVVNVDDAPDAFAEGEDSTGITLTGSVDALADGIQGTEVTVTPEDADRAALLAALNFDKENPLALFAGVQGALRGMGTSLTSMTGGGLDTPIPLVGSSVGQILGAGASGGEGVTYTPQAAVEASDGPPVVEAVPATTVLDDPAAGFGPEFVGRQVVVGSTTATVVDQVGTTLVLAPQIDTNPEAATPYLVENELLGAAHVLENITPATLQEAIAMAQASLGNESTIDFGLVDGDDGAQLRLDVEWKRAYSVSRPVSLELPGGQQVVAASGSGEVSLDAAGSVGLGLLLPLSTDAVKDPIANTLVDPDASGIDLDIAIAAEKLHIGASLGPISVDLGKPGSTDAAELGSVNAGLGLTVEGTDTKADNTAGLPSITDYFRGFSATVDNGGACEGAEVMCAQFPMYVSGTSVPGGDLTVTASMPAAGTAPTLQAILGGVVVTPPSGLQGLIEGKPFKFTSLSEGLQQYLFYTEASLRIASNNGEMPVVGKDLQAGADFMGETRTKLDEFIKKEGLENIEKVSEARKYLTQVLADELDIVVNGPTGIIVDFTCNSILEPPAAPTAKTTPAAPPASSTTAYSYAVVSVFTDKAGTAHESAPSDASAAVMNAAGLSDTTFNTVSWTKVPGVNGYKILRDTTPAPTTQVPEPPRTFQLLATVAGTVTSYAHKSGTPGSGYSAVTKPYRMPGVECGEDALLTDVEGVTLRLKLGQGVISAKDGCVDDEALGDCLGGELPVDLGIPGLSLKTGEGGSVAGKVGWALDLKIGMSRTRGFYIDTSKVNEFEVGANLGLTDVAGTDLSAQLSIIEVDAEKNVETPEFVGYFGIDIRDSKDDDEDLKLSEMAGLKISEAIVVSVSATVNVDWHLEAGADAALPGVGTDFLLTWKWAASTGDDGKPVPAKPGNTKNLKIAFNNVTLNAGEFFGDALQPYLEQVMDATKPLQPVIDTIFTPMPVISDLSKAAGGKEVTIATLAQTFNTLPAGPRIKPFLDAIKTVKALTEVDCTEECSIRIGSFTLLGDRATTTSTSAANAKTMINRTDDYKPVTNAGETLAKADSTNQLTDPAKVTKAAALKAGLKAGVAIPVMEDPTILFDLISGGDIPLVEFDSGPLAIGFQFQKSFGPIYAPPPVMMVIGGGASVTLRVAAGFDTYGIRRAMETGDGAEVLDSLYFKTIDANGKPIPVVQFTGYLEAGASVSIGILEVGVKGGIKLTVGFYWNDPNNDGKFRLFEFSGAVANNPICLFNVGGELSLYIKVFVVIGFSPFAVDFDFTLVNIKLLDFNLKPDCTPPPPRLGGTNGNVLYVFAGKFGGAGPRGNAAWDSKGTKDETWVVRSVPAYTDADGVPQPATVEVRGLGITESFPDAGADAINTVVLDGRGYGGSLTVSFTGGQSPSFTNADPPVADGKTEPFTKTAVVLTGSGDDNISSGEGKSWVDSGTGNDLVTTADRVDLSKALVPDSGFAHVAGGPGADVITVGNGNDTVTGDGSLDVKDLGTISVKLAGSGTTSLIAPVDVSKLVTPDAAALTKATTGTDGADQIAAGLGSVVLAGNGGNDVVGTANDSTLADSSGIKAGTPGGSATTEALYRAHASVLIGGAGGDVMKSGSADDEVYTGTYAKIGESEAGAGDNADDTNVVDTGTGSDKVYGSNGKDFVTTSSRTAQSSTVYGGAGTDVLTGGLGTDALYGGPDNDYLVASPATVGEPGSATDDLGPDARLVGVLPGAGASKKLLVGGTGSDRIYGSDGPSDIFGDTTADGCAVQSDPVSKQPQESNVLLDADDLILGGNGVDVINAGGGDDWVYASGEADRVCGNAGVDRLHAGDGDDLVHGGSGNDQGFGDADADQVYGNQGDDSLYGAEGTDRLQGNQGSDWLDGGADDDVVLGGTSKSGTADGADVLYGAEGADLLVGDNAQTDELASAPYPTDLGSTDTTLGGNDHLGGGDDADAIYGGLADDVSYGGLGDDYAEGNPGTDRTWGEDGDDDIVGGSSQLASGTEAGRPDTNDYLYGGSGQDVIAGDNASITRGGAGHPLMTGRGLTVARGVDLADEGSGNPAGVSGDDTIESGDDTDLVFGQRGADTVSLGGDADYGEGGPGADRVHGDAGDDDVVGGSHTPAVDNALKPTGQPDGADVLFGDAGQDVVLGDNGAVTRPTSTGLVTSVVPSVTASRLTTNRVTAARSITPYDLGDTPLAATSGSDTLTGDADNDVLLGQAGNDRVDGGTEADYAEGGQDSDLVLGGDGDDDLAGGSSATITDNAGGPAGQPDASDNVDGGSGSDLVIGDNGLLTRVATGRDWRTNRADAMQAVLVPGRAIELFDLSPTSPLSGTTTRAAADSLSGRAGVDVLLGQDGDDRVSGGGNDDYVEGEGGADVIHGDLALTSAEIVPAPAGAAWSTPSVDTDPVSEGQDDLTGGSSRAGHRDGNDTINGDGDDDFVVGDNGTVARIVGTDAKEKVYTERYGPKRAGHAKVRVFPTGITGVTSTRFCTAPASPSQTSTCEVAGAFGADTILGDAGQDVLYGQDGVDTIRGGADDDDVYGELGGDLLYGDAGEDAILGDRGGVQNRYETGARTVTSTLQMPPQVTYRSRLDGSVSREADLLHDVNGTSLVGTATSAAMPLDGITYGGIDRIRGGDGNDSIHAGAGADLVNGDTGGDHVFGGRGNDAMWGGQGRPCAEADATCQADPGVNGEWVDHLMGGKDEDVIDWRPRGLFGTLSGTTYTGRTCSTSAIPATTKKDGTTDPCSWFEMTDRADDIASAVSRANNQHHQGIDWIYGGWDRDVMQGDQSANGPNPGDRLIDWSGVYNLYSHCNAAYGGFNDIRIPSPSMEKFVQEWATGLGAGRPGDVTVPGTSAYDELALVTNSDGKGHGTGSAYPSTPGHFDNAGACSGF
ncbi:calcium-binding protein [Nocardioides glacieisoli]|uniref:calcium-binding protein n=1 Tax=Nocardioides glacieisoli TaxID=1168730 RepID=UPI0013EBDF49|nr:calcium-binding protein [Nocardioides glacieisoli]